MHSSHSLTPTPGGAAFVPRSVALFSLVLALALSLLAGCSERDLSDLPLAPANTDPVVFDDAFGESVDFQAFSGSLLEAIAMDATQARVGTTSLKVTVPGPGGTGGTYAGGAFTCADYRDLSGYDALVFYAKSSVNSTLDVAGFGNDNTGLSLYDAQRAHIPLTTDWALIAIPIPDPSRLTLERGLFFFAEGYENNQGFTLWFDEIRFVRMGTILNPRPTMASRTVDTFLGGTVTPEQTRVLFSVNGVDMLVDHSPRYFDFFSSDETVVQTAGGAITAVGGGTAMITAKLDTVDVAGSITVNVLAPPDEPAPTPTLPSGDVIALFSDAYSLVPVDTWRASWSSSGPVDDFAIDGDDVKAYTGLVYAGIEFTTHLIDATGMTHIRLDIWAPVGNVFRVKLVDFGEDGIYNPPVDQSELTFTASSTPAFVAGQWSVLDIPLDQFTLTSRAHLAQIVISSSDARTVFLDNVLFHK
ncbi:MAG: hypothetical protein KBD56_09570 [Candidatus Eisenbacteria bacterium]|nr:hypothetical protein [Candidatus Eisenbacteria bacterium]